MKKFLQVAMAIMLCSSAFCADIDAKKKAAEQGDATAQFSIGRAYYSGRGVPQNYKEAMKWYQKAAEQGNTNAQSSIGLAYCKGNGVPQDYEEAVRWFRKAAEQGNTIAQRGLGVSYYYGKGGSSELRRSIFLDESFSKPILKILRICQIAR